MPKPYKFGHKMPRKSWSSSEFDQEWENKKLGLVLLGMLVLFILLAVFMWWTKNHGR